jgi:arylsulfatase A-like enzyme
MDTEPERMKDHDASLAAVLRSRATALFPGRFRYLAWVDDPQPQLRPAGDADMAATASQVYHGPEIRRLLRWVDGLPRGQRFLATWIPIAGHHPYETPEPGPFPDNEEIDRYRNAQHYADASLGALLRGLKERGLEKDTLVVVIGDHGQAFGQHPGNFGHTLFIYEENVHVPFVIAVGCPRRAAACEADREPVDLAPTVLDLLRLPVPVRTTRADRCWVSMRRQPVLHGLLAGPGGASRGELEVHPQSQGGRSALRPGC